jgi:hypothetical protein
MELIGRERQSIIEVVDNAGKDYEFENKISSSPFFLIMYGHSSF